MRERERHGGGRMKKYLRILNYVVYVLLHIKCENVKSSQRQRYIALRTRRLSVPMPAAAVNGDWGTLIIA